MQNNNCIGCKTHFQQASKLPLQGINLQLKYYPLPIKEQRHKWNLLRTICSFLNSKGGIIFIGVEDSGIVRGYNIQRKELDDFKIFVEQLTERIQPKVDLSDKEDVIVNVYLQIFVQFLPVLSKGKFLGKYLIKIVVKQGQPSELYCFSQKIQLQSQNDKKTDQYEIIYSYVRQNSSTIKQYKGYQLLNLLKARVSKPPKIAPSFHQNCHPQPLNLESNSNLQQKILKIGFSKVQKNTREILQQWCQVQLAQLGVSQPIVSYDKQNSMIVVQFISKTDFQKGEKFVKQNLGGINAVLEGVCKFVRKDQQFLDCIVYENVEKNSGNNLKMFENYEKKKQTQEKQKKAKQNVVHTQSEKKKYIKRSQMKQKQSKQQKQKQLLEKQQTKNPKQKQQEQQQEQNRDKGQQQQWQDQFQQYSQEQQTTTYTKPKKQTKKLPKQQREQQLQKQVPVQKKNSNTNNNNSSNSNSMKQINIQAQSKKVQKYPQPNTTKQQKNKQPPFEKKQKSQKQPQQQLESPSKNSKRTKSIPKKYSLTFTHINPKTKQALVLFLDALIPCKKNYQIYQNTIQFFLPNQDCYDQFYWKVIEQMATLQTFGFKNQIKFGANTGQIDILNFDRNKGNQLLKYLKTVIGKQLIQSQIMRHGNNYSISLLLQKPCACKWLDKLLMDNQVKAFQIPGAEKGQKAKIKIHLLCLDPQQMLQGAYGLQKLRKENFKKFYFLAKAYSHTINFIKSIQQFKNKSNQFIYNFAPYMFTPAHNIIQKNAIQQDIKQSFTAFLYNYQHGKYYKIMKQSAQQGRKQNVIVIQNQDIMTFNNDVAFTIFEEYYKYEKLLNDTFGAIMRQILKEEGENFQGNLKEETFQKYFVAFQSGIGGINQEGLGIRELTCSKIGKLQRLRGTVTRTTQVRPQLVIGIFKCKICNRFSRPIDQQFKYTEPKRCLNQNCDSKSWQLDLSKSQFADFQQLRVQQDPNTIPAGSMPRSINVILRNYNVQKAQPGDICKFVGYLCVTPQIVSMLKPGERTTLTTRNMQTRGNVMEMQGVKGISGIRQLNYKLVFIANNVTVQNKQNTDITPIQQQQQVMPEITNPNQQQRRQFFSSQKIYEKLFENYSQSEIKQISDLRSNPRLYEDLADSLFPGIFGHPEIKKALLLQLFGGVHKTTIKNKINIRGDINILIVGDPSTAKSQFLKTVNKFVTRSVYTNGKTTSAAGLTASVMRDQMGNVGIQAGALMLADNGICCIDQFDKMKLTDMTAIHEAMQQQTISIAKAGVHATLNARTSILAAANPLFGRYDKTKNLQKNINISAPIMSRFDLYFVICDESNISSDKNLCQFMIDMHRQRDNAYVKKYNTKTLRFYISVARKIKPILTNSAAKKLRQCYINVRKNCKEMGQGASYLATVRQLQSMIRLSQALAKLHLDLEVTSEHVEQAYRLIQNSITKLQKADVVMQQQMDKKQKVQDILNQQVKKKKQQKKKNTITISAEAYDEITNNIFYIFKKQRKLKKQLRPEQKLNISLQQGNIINYVISVQLQKGTLNTEEQEKNYRKIVNAVIKKLINKERKIMVQEENQNQDQRVLKLHPNYLAIIEDKEQHNMTNMNMMREM